MLAQSQTVAQHYFTIGSMYRVIWVVAFRGMKCHPYGQSKHRQSPNSVSRLSQRRVQLTGIETAIGCDARSTLNRYWVGGPTLCVRGTCTDAACIEAYTDLSAIVVEGIGLNRLKPSLGVRELLF